MHSYHKNPLKISLIANTCMLITLGLLTLYTSSALKGIEFHGDSTYFLKKQLLTVSLGSFVVYMLQVIPFNWINKLTLPSILLSFLLLLLTVIPGFGYKAGGATRWLNFGLIKLQAAEIAKLSMILFLAKNLSLNPLNTKFFNSRLIINFMLLALFVILLLLQPDFGSTALLIIITITLMYYSGIHLKNLLWSSCCAAIFSVIAILSAPYRAKRLVSFLDPWSNIKTGGFQIIQSFLGFQNGGLWGLGPGLSKQKLFFLPEAHTDFIFAVVAEEFGLFGTLVIVLLFVNLLRIGVNIALLQVNKHKKLLAIGITTLLVVQAVLNMGVVMGLLPTKGLPLPFISSGSSSMLVFMTSLGLLIRLSKEIESIEGTKEHCRANPLHRNWRQRHESTSSIH